jgi:hypothetical protein
MHVLLLAFVTIVGFANPQAGSAGAENLFVGKWTSNFSKSKLPSNYQYRSLALQFAVVFDTVTIGSRLITTSGQDQTVTELFHMDGKEHPGTLSPGVVLVARWVNSRMIETSGKKDGQDVGVITYEISADGKTLTERLSNTPEQVLVFDRR